MSLLSGADVQELLADAAGRACAIRQHVLDMPAPIVAEALGYHHVTTAKLAAQAGGTWSRYAPGDHSRSSPDQAQLRIHDSQIGELTRRRPSGRPAVSMTGTAGRGAALAKE